MIEREREKKKRSRAIATAVCARWRAHILSHKTAEATHATHNPRGSLSRGPGNFFPHHQQQSERSQIFPWCPGAWVLGGAWLVARRPSFGGGVRARLHVMRGGMSPRRFPEDRQVPPAIWPRLHGRMHSIIQSATTDTRFNYTPPSKSHRDSTPQQSASASSHPSRETRALGLFPIPTKPPPAPSPR